MILFSNFKLKKIYIYFIIRIITFQSCNLPKEFCETIDTNKTLQEKSKIIFQSASICKILPYDLIPANFLKYARTV